MRRLIWLSPRLDKRVIRPGSSVDLGKRLSGYPITQSKKNCTSTPLGISLSMILSSGRAHNLRVMYLTAQIYGLHRCSSDLSAHSITRAQCPGNSPSAFLTSSWLGSLTFVRCSCCDPLKTVNPVSRVVRQWRRTSILAFPFLQSNYSYVKWLEHAIKEVCLKSRRSRSKALSARLCTFLLK